MKKFAESLFYLCLVGLLVVGIGLGIEQLNKDDEDVPETPVTEEVEVLNLTIQDPDGVYNVVEIQYEDGMTWGEWLVSEYNNDLLNSSDIFYGPGQPEIIVVAGTSIQLHENSNKVRTIDLIESSLEYYFYD